MESTNYSEAEARLSGVTLTFSDGEKDRTIEWGTHHEGARVHPRRCSFDEHALVTVAST